MPKFKCPASEESMMECLKDGQVAAYKTRKITEPTKHFLYMIVDGVWKKVKSSDNPYDFDEMIWGKQK